MRFCPRCGTRYPAITMVCPDDGTPTAELPPEPTTDPLLGTIVDNRYRIEKQIGEGGMGVVYAVTHTAIGKRLAMKVLRGDMARDQDVVKRFVQEAQSATSIGHENIIDISDFGRLPDESVYFVMEFLDGESLTNAIQRGGSLPIGEATHIIRQIASALGAAHARGIVHRDLKPDNIYLVRRGDGSQNFVKVLDFGIAKVGGASSKLTKAGMVFGTPHYMSPEQAAGQSVDQRTDIYALGVIMYQMFVGRVPFDADTFMGILTKHMFEPPMPLSEAVNGAVRLGAMEPIVMKSLAKKPEQRYQTMAELNEDLDRVAAGGNPSGQRSLGIADALEPMSRTEWGMSVAPPKKSKTAMIIGIVVGLLVIGGGAAAFMLLPQGNQTPAPQPTALGTTVPAVPAPTPLPGTPPQELGAPAVPIGVDPPAPSVVAINSDPPGAMIFVNGALVGNAPTSIPRPEVGERSVEVRANGYRAQTLLLTLASPDAINVVLTRESSGSSRRSHSESGGSGSPPSTPPARSFEGSRANPSEIADPWN